MQHFTAALELHLRKAARRRDRTHRMTSTARIAAPTCAVVAGVVALVSGGGDTTPAAALPVIASQPVASHDVPRKLRQVTGAGAIPAQTHAFNTPYGQGYAMISSDRKTVCVAVPDKVEGFGSTCAPMAKVERVGLPIRLLSEPGSGPSELVIVLPQGGTHANAVHADGTTQPLEISNGVAAGLFAKDATVTYDSASGEQRLQMIPYAPEGQWYVGCGPHQSAVAVPGRAGALHPKKYCDAANRAAGAP
jgi:hypothetical protein